MTKSSTASKGARKMALAGVRRRDREREDAVKRAARDRLRAYNESRQRIWAELGARNALEAERRIHHERNLARVIVGLALALAGVAAILVFR